MAYNGSLYFGGVSCICFLMAFGMVTPENFPGVFITNGQNGCNSSQSFGVKHINHLLKANN